MFNIRVLEDFYAWVSADDGVDVLDLQSKLKELFQRDRSTEDIHAYRLGKRPWKKLSDEIVPVSQFLAFRGIESGRIRFPLDNDPPDCWLWRNGNEVRTAIEVTIAQGRERRHLMNELNDKGMGRGFIGVPDDADEEEFAQRMKEERTAYSTEEALSAIQHGVALCLSRKNRQKYKDFILIIYVPLRPMPFERWNAMVPCLRNIASNLPFEEVCIVGESERDQELIQIK